MNNSIQLNNKKEFIDYMEEIHILSGARELCKECSKLERGGCCHGCDHITKDGCSKKNTSCLLSTYSSGCSIVEKIPEFHNYMKIIRANSNIRTIWFRRDADIKYPISIPIYKKEGE